MGWTAGATAVRCALCAVAVFASAGCFAPVVSVEEHDVDASTGPDASLARDAGQNFGCQAPKRCEDRCPSEDPLKTIPSSPVGPCACGVTGTTSFAESCRQDSDCVLAPATCCDCANGGTTVAVLRENRATWVEQIEACCDGVICTVNDRCGGEVVARCEGGKCVARLAGTDAGR